MSQFAGTDSVTDGATKPPAYRICRQCVMDTTDPDIEFDAEGICTHCKRYEAHVSSASYIARRRPGAIKELADQIKRDGAGKRYDCVIGVSGGVDSSYVAYYTKRVLGLRPLAVHLDNGWNSELAVKNIEELLKRLEIDLRTVVLDWDEFRDIQLAFLKGSTPDCEIPTDHAIAAALYKFAAREGVRYILCGNNTATEYGGVAAWSQGHNDWKYIRSVHEQYGTRPIRSFPHYSLLSFAYLAGLRRIRLVPILDYVDRYDKKEILEFLEKDLGWRNYGGKHYESIYTRFYQGWFLPKKFNADKRKVHLSSLIWSKQITREQALESLKTVDYSDKLAAEDRTYVIKKLGIDEADFNAILRATPRSYWDFPSYKKSLQSMPSLVRLYHRLRGH